MAAILSETDVVDGVLAAVDDDGPIPPTARRLAARLHVAPATLYSAIPAMGCAYRNARADLISRAVGSLVDAFARGDSERLVADILNRPNAALFMTDPGVVLAMNPMVERALRRIDLDAQALGDLLALVGSVFSRRHLDSPAALGAKIDRVVAWYQDSMLNSADAQVVDAPVAFDAAAILGLAEVGPRVDPGRPSRTGPDAEAARRASAEIVIQTSQTQWSFRELSRLTGIPVTRLHRYGSRTDHLARAAADLLSATDRWAHEHSTTASASTTVATVVETQLADVLMELYRAARSAEPGDDSLAFDDVLCGVLSPAAVALMSARSTNGDDRATIARLTTVVTDSLAA